MKELMEILEELRPDVDFEAEKELITGGVLDSFDVISLISSIEENFNVSIKPKMITSSNFDSLDSIMRLINSLK